MAEITAERKRQIAERMRKWRAANHDHKRSALLAGSVGRVTAKDIKALYKQQQGKCPACKRELNSGYHLDHVMPLYLGGAHTPDNTQLLCAKCNLKKGKMHPDKWAAQHGRLFV